MHDSVYDIAGDDPRMAKFLRGCLTALAAGPDKPLREMAEGVLRDEIDLREAAMSEAYGEELGQAFDRFWTDYEQLSQEDRDDLVTRAEAGLDALLT